MDIETWIYDSRLGPDFPLPVELPFSSHMAQAAGVGRRTLERLLQEGLVRHPIRGVYVATQVGDSLALRTACLRLVAPEDAVIVDRHAGWLHGAQMVLRPGEHLELAPVRMFLPADRGRLRIGLADSGERSFAPTDLMELDGLRVTTPLRTAFDLGRVRWADTAIAGLDAMLRLGAFEREELLDGVRRFRGMRWVTTLRALAPLADGRAESPGESVLRLRCHEVGLRGVVPQVEVWRDGRLLARLDLGEEELMLAVEYDGEEWHSAPEQRAHDLIRREAVAEEGWSVVALGKDSVFGRGATATGFFTRPLGKPGGGVASASLVEQFLTTRAPPAYSFCRLAVPRRTTSADSRLSGRATG